MFAQRLREVRKEKGLTLEDLARMYNKNLNGEGGLNKGTLSKYENNKQQPLLDTVSSLAEFLQVSTDYLLGKTDYKNHHDMYSDIKNKSGNNSEIIDKVLTKIPLYTVPVSAGHGEWLNEGCEYDFIYLNNVPSNADFSLKVRGDSMSPLYCDEDIVFVRSNVIVESGQIGVFYLNGEGYLKMLRGNKLISLNDTYSEIIISEFDSFFCVGRVVGKAT